MGKHEKFEERLFAKGSENNLDFDDLIGFLDRIGDLVRRPGKHRQGVIFACPSKGFILNLQPDKNGKAQAYQVRQVRKHLTLLFDKGAQAKQRLKPGMETLK